MAKSRGFGGRAGGGQEGQTLAALVEEALGVAEQNCRAGRLDRAASLYRQILARSPENSRALHGLGMVLQAMGDNAGAALLVAAAVAARPDFATAHFDLGNLHLEGGRFQEAEEHYRRALALDPHLAAVHANLGTVLEEQGQTGEAIESFEHTLALDPTHGQARWHARLALPAIYRSAEEVGAWRDRFARNLEVLIAESDPTDLQTLRGAATHTNFYLQYQGLDDTALQRRYGEFLARIAAAHFPDWASPLRCSLAPGERIRIGYASSHLLSHSATRWLMGWLTHHDRTRFEVFGYHTGAEADTATTAFATACDHFRHFHDLEAACRAIRADRLHILVYPDIGMEPRDALMAALRLAPVQCAAWGHPVTTGLPTVDYFLSGKAMEADDGQRFYSEKLLCLPEMGLCYPRPPLPPGRRDRAHFGLAAHEVVFLSCQALYKYLPQRDWVFAAIARNLPQARCVFVVHPSDHVTAVFRDRLVRAFAAVDLDWQERCTLLPRLDYLDYLDLVAAADVYLDTFDFSGGNTALEAVTCRLPIVTCPGPSMRSRLAAAVLTVLGAEETLARDAEHYVEIAVGLGSDPARRAALARQYAEGMDCLFDNPVPVAALDAVLENLVRDRAGN
jgi:predicted O-linked N-acetylglucosamine transferase (SPINDLY family)